VDVVAARGAVTGRGFLVALLGFVSVVYIGLEVAGSWSELTAQQIPGVGWLLVAIVALALGQFVVGEAMVVLEASPSTGAQRRWIFHTAQPAKYVPFGIANAAAVVLGLCARGVPSRIATLVWAIHSLALALVGVAVGLIAGPALGWSAAVSALGVILLLAVAPPIFGRVLRVAGRVVGADLSASLPASRSIVTCTALAAIAVGLHAVGFAILVRGADLDVTLLGAVAAYALAFGVSVATPLPGGLGAREAVLLAVLVVDEATLLVPVVLVRLLLVGTECGFLVVARLRLSRADGVVRDGGAEGVRLADPR